MAVWNLSSKLFPDGAEITWSSPIMEYVIQRKRIDAAPNAPWIEVGRAPHDVSSYFIGDSFDGYRYHVAAKCVPFTESIVIQRENAPPKIPRENQEYIQIERGCTHIFEVKYFGDSIEEVIWTRGKDGGKLPNGISFACEQSFTGLHRYKIKVDGEIESDGPIPLYCKITNQWGSAEAEYVIDFLNPEAATEESVLSSDDGDGSPAKRSKYTSSSNEDNERGDQDGEERGDQEGERGEQNGDRGDHDERGNHSEESASNAFKVE